MKDELLKFWHIQEYLLQSYRRLFTTSQSIIFAIASIMATNHEPTVLSVIVYAVLLILGLFLYYYWNQIAKSTGMDVSYFQMLLLRCEQGEQLNSIMINFKDWQKQSTKSKLDELKKYDLDHSNARTILEKYLSAVFLILWITLTLIVLTTLFGNLF